MGLNKETIIVDYLRLVQAGDLTHEEICELLKVDPKAMRLLLSTTPAQTLMKKKLSEFKMTFSDRWHTVDQYLEKGFSDDEIASFLNFPVDQIHFRRKFIADGIIHK